MSYRLDIRVEFISDLSQAITWYERKEPGLGLRLREAVRECVRQVHERPLSFGEIGRAIRKATPKKFPYGVFFQVEDGQILVFALLHDSRSPSVWRRRGRALRKRAE